MKITFKEWALFILAAVLCFGIWLKLGYRQLSFVNLTVNRQQALNKAESKLHALGADPREYSRAVAFESDNWADRYLQKTVGLKSEEAFINQYGYDLFFWKIRFFKQFQKEEYIIKISSTTGELISFEHLLEDIAPRETINKDIAKQDALVFLSNVFGIDFSGYDFHEEKIKRYDKRTDYTFSWEKRGVYMPWKKNEGGGKLLVSATVCGNKVEQFYKNKLDVPEKFRRYVENQLALGEYLYSFYFIVFMFLVISSIVIVVKRRSNVLMRFCKKWFLYLAAIVTAVNLAFIFNNIQSILIYYPTSLSLASFLGTYLIKESINFLLLGATLIMAGIAGESLRNDVFKSSPHISFLHFLRSTFYNRTVSHQIILGYILFFILIGVQAFLFNFGQTYLGVWKEWFRMAQFSSAYVPFLSACAIGLSASFNEEVLYRLFGITWGKKYLKNTILAVVFTSLLWGFGHSQYAIFPVWFRGIEVTILGLIYGFIFIKYGIIPLIVAHYLFDVFWGVAAYILGHATAYLFTSSLIVLAIPLIFAFIAYFVNSRKPEIKISTILDDIQRYNLNILLAYVSEKKSQGSLAGEISDELVRNNWDIELVGLAVKQVFKN